MKNGSIKGLNHNKHAINFLSQGLNMNSMHHKNVLIRNLLLLISYILLLITSSCSVTKQSYTVNYPVVQQYNFSSEVRHQVLETAEQYLGTPYKYGGKTPGGFDCSGFTSYVMAKNGIALSPTSSLQAKQGKKVSSTHAKKGDLVFFEHGGKINHVGIVKEAHKNKLYVIHSTTSSGVRIDEVLHNPYWANRIIFAISVLD